MAIFQQYGAGAGLPQFDWQSIPGAMPGQQQQVMPSARIPGLGGPPAGMPGVPPATARGPLQPLQPLAPLGQAPAAAAPAPRAPAPGVRAPGPVLAGRGPAAAPGVQRIARIEGGAGTESCANRGGYPASSPGECGTGEVFEQQGDFGCCVPQGPDSGRGRGGSGTPECEEGLELWNGTCHPVCPDGTVRNTWGYCVPTGGPGGGDGDGGGGEGEAAPGECTETETDQGKVVLADGSCGCPPGAEVTSYSLGNCVCPEGQGMTDYGCRPLEAPAIPSPGTKPTFDYTFTPGTFPGIGSWEDPGGWTAPEAFRPCPPGHIRNLEGSCVPSALEAARPRDVREGTEFSPEAFLRSPAYRTAVTGATNQALRNLGARGTAIGGASTAEIANRVRDVTAEAFDEAAGRHAEMEQRQQRADEANLNTWLRQVGMEQAQQRFTDAQSQAAWQFIQTLQQRWQEQGRGLSFQEWLRNADATTMAWIQDQQRELQAALARTGLDMDWQRHLTNIDLTTFREFMENNRALLRAGAASD